MKDPARAPWKMLMILAITVPALPAGADEAGSGGDTSRSKSQAEQRSFSGGGMLFGRSVKPPVGARRFAVGLDMAVAPMDIAYRIAGDRVRDKAIDSVCEGSSDPDCRATAGTYVDAAMDALARVPDSQWDKVEAAAGGDTAGLNQVLADAGVPPSQRQAVLDYVAQVEGSPEEKRAAVRLARGVASNRGVNLLFEPWAEFNSRWIGVGLGIPFTLRVRDGHSSAHLGNVSLDVRSGGVWGQSVAFGLTGGLNLTLPTGTAAVGASVPADLFRAPKYMHAYLGLAPYLVLGFDLGRWWEVHGHLEFVTLHAVRGGASGSSQYLKYGVGTILLPRLFINLIAEVNGVSPIRNAAAMNALFVSGGVQFRFWIMRLAIAAQGPVFQADDRDAARLAGVSIGTLSRFSVLGRLAFSF